MTIQDAFHEVEIEDACQALGLDEETTAFVLASHRFNDGLLKTMLAHGADHVGYVQAKLAIRDTLDGEG